MHNPLLELSALIVTYGVFGAAGYPLVRKFSKPVAVGTWVAFVISIIVLGFSSLGDTWVVGIGGFHIYLLNAIQAVVIGVLIGLLVREVRNKRLSEKSA